MPAQNLAGNTMMQIADTARESETEGNYLDRMWYDHLITHSAFLQDVMRLMSIRRVGDDEMAIGGFISEMLIKKSAEHTASARHFGTRWGC